MQIVGHVKVFVEIWKNQHGQIEPCIEQCQLGFLQGPAAILRLQFRFDHIRMRHFPAVLQILRQFEKAVAFIRRFLRREQFLLGRRDGVIVLNDGNHQTAGCNFGSGLGGCCQG